MWCRYNFAQVLIIDIPTAPVAAFTVSPSVVCSSQTLTLDASGSLNAVSYSWEVPGAMPSSSSEKSPTFEFAFPGFYNITLIVENEFGRDTLLIPNAVLILTPPELDFSFQLEADSATVRFRQNSNTARTQTWDFGDGTKSTARNPTHQYQNPGVYEIFLIVENECGQDSMRQVVNIGSQPAAPQAIFTISAPEICPSNSVTLDASNSFAADTYFWTVNGASPSTSEEITPSFNFPMPGFYDVQLVVGNELGFDTLVQTNAIQVLDTPEASFEFQATEQDTIIQFNYTGNSFTSILWNFGDGDTSDTVDPLHNYDGPGEYEVMLVVNNLCGTDTLQRFIKVGNLPAAPTAILEIDKPVACVLDQVNFSAVSSVGAESFSWKFDGPNTVTSNGETAVLIFSDPGFYDITLIAINEFGADTLFLKNGLKVVETPTARFESSIDKNAVQFTNLSVNAESYFWDFGNGKSSKLANPFHAYDIDGTFVVSMSAINPCDTVTVLDTLTIAPFFPRASFTASATGGCLPFSVNFVNESANADSYQWSFPGGVPETSTESNPMVTYTEPGVYDVSLVVLNNSGRAILDRTDYIEVFPNPIADFSYEVDSNLVTFTNQSENAAFFEWIFDGGDRSMLENPFYEFNKRGTYLVQLVAQNICASDTVSVQIFIDIPLRQDTAINTSIQEPDWAKDFKIYPNPSRGQFIIEGKGIVANELRLEIIGAQGEKLFQQSIKKLSGGNVQHQVNLDGFPNGLYVLKFGTKEEVIYRRILITR